ncbi:MAG: hypothetical protein HY290_10000 [Planctomycetia bacterium]|nr:hypothetical protein [Planctomycetia bacterium]
MIDLLRNLDRRWIFLAMLLAVSIPILAQQSFPERPTKTVLDVFNYIEGLPEGSNILLSFDFGPSSDGELEPIATAVVRHCCLKRHKMFFMTLYPDGVPLPERTIKSVIEQEFESYNFKYGEDYINLGFNNAEELVIIVMGTDIKKMFPTDIEKKPLDGFPIAENITSLEDMDLIFTITTGYPGMKEWVQYGSSPLGVKLAVGSTAVQAPEAYPYLPDQMLGLLAAIKGAAEYEAALADKYPAFRDPAKNQGIKRMAPQFWAHLLIIGLIVLGNVVYFADRFQGARR